MTRRIAIAICAATLLAGTLDILSAFVFAGVGGVQPLQVLMYIASGPFGDRAFRGEGWAAVGLLVHFAIMACMVGAYMGVAPRAPVLLSRPVLAGTAYGALLWLIMSWVVRPLRWPEAPLPHTIYEIANQLFSHCVLVGLPIALIASRTFRRRADGD